MRIIFGTREHKSCRVRAEVTNQPVIMNVSNTEYVPFGKFINVYKSVTAVFTQQTVYKILLQDA